MPSVQLTPLPTGALLERYAASGAYTDCYAVTIPVKASFVEFMAVFYTTPVFKIERRLLARFLGYSSNDYEAQLLAQGKSSSFSAWDVESRESNQTILAAGRTRLWLMSVQLAPESEATTLFFGSAVLKSRQGKVGWQFSALLGFHKLYSRILLASAARELLGAKAKA